MCVCAHVTVYYIAVGSDNLKLSYPLVICRKLIALINDGNVREKVRVKYIYIIYSYVWKFLYKNNTEKLLNMSKNLISMIFSL